MDPERWRRVQTICEKAGTLTARERESYLCQACEGDQQPLVLPALKEPGAHFVPWSWSRDSQLLAGWELWDDGRREGIVVYSTVEHRFQKLSERGIRPVWLQDSRRLLFADGDKLKLVDRSSNNVKEILNVSPHSLARLCISGDNRVIFVGVYQEEGDIWLASLK